jgi:hypothetical protein
MPKWAEYSLTDRYYPPSRTQGSTNLARHFRKYSPLKPPGVPLTLYYSHWSSCGFGDYVLSPPLGGKTIVITRAAEQTSQFSEILQNQGAEVLEMPALEIRPPTVGKV